MIITHHNTIKFPLLRMLSQPCKFPLSPEEFQCQQNMTSTMQEMGNLAVGLSAVQMGLPKRMFAIKLPNHRVEIFINPEVIQVSAKTGMKVEGCLSLPGLFFSIQRSRSITLQYYNTLGDQKTQTFSGNTARAVAHELDHLDGVLLDTLAEKQSEKLITKNRQKTVAKTKARLKAKRLRKLRKKSRR